MERLSEEALRMCRMCAIKDNISSLCGIYDIVTQNKLAEDGKCTDAKIQGPTTRFTHLYNDTTPGLFTQIVGRMEKLENGDWVFESGSFITPLHK